MKKIYTTFFILLNFLLCAQKTPTSFDRIYLNVDDLQFDQIKDAEIENFQFVNPTLNLDYGVYIFQVKPFDFMPKKMVKQIKKISTYVKYALSGDKNLFSYDLFDPEGKKYFTNERGYISIYYHYDEKKRLKEKIRVVKTDTVDHSKYQFNVRNQLLALSETAVEYDYQNMPIRFKNTKFPNSPYLTVLRYDKNKVRIEERNVDEIVGFREFTYSENDNLIKENYKNRTVFNSYNDKNQKIKSVEFNNKNLYSIENFEYNEMGDLTMHRFRFSGDIKNGTKAESRSHYKYDQWGNKIYVRTEGEINAITTEHFYEIEYY
ncbi:hypothetical protein [Chryseobacterium caseinilyticum]|uniref:Sugar-binding protein n=1 Tax=Chryseobacterium caseinilyticum TaxID=2771428 RepID=A0ABR8ZH07_9FLAO|nr:hypothetical protein [Chryseobacterium caseinilyticum]MBD8084588.1 hypothetical protein [Chryseobacterium caseinilyticum]